MTRQGQRLQSRLLAVKPGGVPRAGISYKVSPPIATARRVIDFRQSNAILSQTVEWI
jgi:hypothetical protein